jgi:hypothetical protein
VADRATLHFRKIDDFAAWAATKGWRREPTKGEWEVLRLRKPGKPPAIYYRKASATQHASTRGDHALGLVRSYVNAKKRGDWPA